MASAEFFITCENLPTYLVQQGLVAEGQPLAVRELGGGVSNLTLLVECPDSGASGERWVVKQSLGQLRVTEDWRSDRARIFREAEALRALEPILGDSVPRVVAVDRENYLCVMTAAPQRATVWKESLLAGRCERVVACDAGRLLARIIAASGANPHFHERFSDRDVFDQLRIDPYYRTTARRHPGLATEFAELIRDTWERRSSLVHGDYSPKNMLVEGDRIFLIDFEVAHWGDPAFDSGFLLNHLCLKAFHRPPFAPLYFDAAREFWAALVCGLPADAPADFEGLTVRHLAALMLARIDGKSPVEYIKDEATKGRVRQAASRLLADPPDTVAEALANIGRAIA